MLFNGSLYQFLCDIETPPTDDDVIGQRKTLKTRKGALVFGVRDWWSVPLMWGGAGVFGYAPVFVGLSAHREVEDSAVGDFFPGEPGAVEGLAV